MKEVRYLYHHGIKGMKWGVRRSPEQLGHETGQKSDVVKIEKSGRISSEILRSAKGFVSTRNKLSGFCLKPGAKHSKEFFDIGYTESDAGLLFKHLEEGFDLSKRISVQRSESGSEKFCIPMKLGVTTRKMFATAWQKDSPNSDIRFISAYIDRRLKEDE